MFEKMKDHLSHHQINNSHYQDGVKIEPYFIDGNGKCVPYVGEVMRITIETNFKFTVSFLSRSGAYQGPRYKCELSGNDLKEIMRQVGDNEVLQIKENF